jgi:hypothetical protein
MAENSSCPAPDPSGLGERINALMTLVGAIPNDAENDFHHYRYTSAEAVLAKVQEGLKSLNLVISTFAKVVDWHGDTVVVSVTIQITRAEDRGVPNAPFVEYTGVGSGTDKGDKAVMKAATAAYKYAWRDGLCIPFGDNPEADAETDRQARALSGGRPAEAAPPRTAPKPPANPKPESEWAQPPAEEEEKFYVDGNHRSYLRPKCFCGIYARPWVKAGKFMSRFYCGRPMGSPEGQCDFVKNV